MKTVQLHNHFQKNYNSLATEEEDIFILSRKRIHLCRETLLAMRKEVMKIGFKSTLEEIHFFKVIKQEALSHLLFNKQLAKLERHCPKTSLKKQESYLKKELFKCDEFFLEHIDFGQYVQIDASYLDELYFTRKTNVSPQFEMQLSEMYDLEFNTPRDTLLAKFSAFKLLVKYIHKRLADLPSKFNNDNLSKSRLDWTANKVDLIELIYALHSIGAIKGGGSEIREIASSFEVLFDVDLGNYYRKFIEIRDRKIQRTKFLDSLKINLLRRMDATDS